MNRANSVALMAIVWFKVSQSAGHIRSIAAAQAAYVVLLGCALHCVLLALNSAALAALALPKAEHRAVLIMASQKTLPMAVTVISLFPASVGEQGLILIPCIIGHLSQLFIDAALVSRWLNQERRPGRQGGRARRRGRAAALADKGGSKGGRGSRSPRRRSLGAAARAGSCCHPSSPERPWPSAGARASAPPPRRRERTKRERGAGAVPAVAQRAGQRPGR